METLNKIYNYTPQPNITALQELATRFAAHHFGISALFNTVISERGSKSSAGYHLAAIVRFPHREILVRASDGPHWTYRDGRSLTPSLAAVDLMNHEHNTGRRRRPMPWHAWEPVITYIDEKHALLGEALRHVRAPADRTAIAEQQRHIERLRLALIEGWRRVTWEEILG